MKLFCRTICGQENEPNSFRNIASIAGGPAQFATIAFATWKHHLHKFITINIIIRTETINKLMMEEEDEMKWQVMDDDIENHGF